MAEHLDEQDVIALVQQTVADIQFAERNTEYRLRRERLYGRKNVQIPGLTNLQTQYHWPRLRKDANAFKNKILAAPLKYTVAANADGPRAAQQAQDMENFAKRHYARWVESGCLDGAVFEMVALGTGVLHPYVNRDVLPMFPEVGDDTDPEAYIKRGQEIFAEFAAGERSDLLCIESVQSDTVYWNPDMSVRLQAARVPIDQFALAHGYGIEDGGEDHGDECPVLITSTAGGVPIDTGRTVSNHLATVYIVEDAEYIYHVVFRNTSSYMNGQLAIPQLGGGTMLGCYKNPFGIPGFLLIDGERTGDPAALYRALPLIDGLYDVGPQVSIMGTLIQSSAIEAVQDMRYIQSAPGAEAAEAREAGAPQVSKLNDGHLWVSDGYQVVQNPVRLPTEVMNAYAAMQKEADLYGFPTALAQPQELNATSGYQQATAQASVSALLDPPLGHWGDGLDTAFRALFTAVKTLDFKEGVSVRNLYPSDRIGGLTPEVARKVTLKPDDIIDVDSSTTFSSTTPQGKIANIEEGAKLVNLNLKSKDQFWTEDMGVEDVARYAREGAISQMRVVGQAAAIEDATKAFQSIRQFVAEKALAAANLKPPMAEAAQEALGVQQSAGAPTMPEQPAPEMTASMPTGPGTASPLLPPQPAGPNL